MPVSLLPVKPMRSTSGWEQSASPTEPPGPVITLKTPSGRPASAMISANFRISEELMLGGFRTQVLPTAMTADILTAVMITGRFQGMMSATTPKGSRRK